MERIIEDEITASRALQIKLVLFSRDGNGVLHRQATLRKSFDDGSQTRPAEKVSDDTRYWVVGYDKRAVSHEASPTNYT